MSTSDATTITLSITGMSCESCQHHVHEALVGVDGVSAADVDLDGAVARVSLTEPSLDASVLVAAVEDAGYGASLSLSSQ